MIPSLLTLLAQRSALRNRRTDPGSDACLPHQSAALSADLGQGDHNLADGYRGSEHLASQLTAQPN